MKDKKPTYKQLEENLKEMRAIILILAVFLFIFGIFGIMKVVQVDDMQKENQELREQILESIPECNKLFQEGWNHIVSVDEGIGYVNDKLCRWEK